MNDTTCVNVQFASTNKKHYSDLGSDASSVQNLRRHFAGKPRVASRHFGCFHRLHFHVYAGPFILCFWFIYSRKMLRACTLQSDDVGNPPCGIGHFTVVCLVPWPLNRREAGGDLVLLQTCLLFKCKSWYSHANKPVNMIIYI